ncbi:acyl-coenzyme A thioesterase 11-like [Coregonus clupeaformis]|uniref:acyl-coenzyme A thioesterase 11-like n=1 Tax=Coregonus clupeaformis TaxID=59861 RepID=UPI001E1C96E7|nr:acyl-coenzyme A thioesterase 11-like [Coregonus clupeaformis]
MPRGHYPQVGIAVSCEDLFSNCQWNVCNAFAISVARRTEAGKVRAEDREGMQLKQVIPRTQTEQMEYSIAAERRRMRLIHAEIIKDLLSSSTAQLGECQEYEDAVPAERTQVESVELVLPPHANHQVSTFGGQIMAWMENVATIAASRLCSAHPTLRTIDMFHFQAPSHIGDRLVLKAIVNNAFKNRQCDVIVQADEDDTIYRVATPCVSKGGKGQDFILMASRRKPCDSRDPYLIALRSVTLPTHLATEEYTRGEVLCAGFSIWEESDSVTKISYYNQATPGVLPYISNDIAGLSSSFYGTFHSCSKYLEENRDSLATLPPLCPVTNGIVLEVLPL